VKESLKLEAPKKINRRTTDCSPTLFQSSSGLNENQSLAGRFSVFAVPAISKGIIFECLFSVGAASCRDRIEIMTIQIETALL
jgi:hypothetical protein